LLGTGWYNF